MLFQATLILDLLTMAVTLWGAFYLFARGFPSGITLRAVVLLLLLSAFFLGAYNNIFSQVPGTASVRAVLLILGLATWYNLTYRLMSAPWQARLRVMEAGIYLLAGITALSLLAIPDSFVNEEGNALYVAHMRLGFPYILYGIFQIAIVLGILYNLLANERVGLTPQGRYFLVASIFPGLGTVSGIVGLAVLEDLPRLVPDLFILSGVTLLGISVASHQTLIERRTTMQDFPLSLITILALAGIYVWLALRWDLPLERLGFVVAFVILTHSTYDLVREFLDRLRIRRENAFRRQFRKLENQGPRQEALQAHLQAGLDLLCETLQASGGFIAVRQDEHFPVIATHGSFPAGSPLSAAQLECDDICRPAPGGLPGISWIAPAFDGRRQVAVIALGKPAARLEYSTGDLDLLAEVADQVGIIVSLSERSSGNQGRTSDARAKETEMHSAAGEMMASISAGPDADFVRMVEDGLRHFSDYIALGQSSLAEWAGIRAGSHVERGKQLQRLLADAMDAFCPGGPRPPEPLPRVWYNYVVLYDAYVEGVPNREIMARLYISEGTFNRTRRNALRGLARLLLERAGHQQSA